MSSADPYVVRIPQWVYKQNDEELRAWFDYDNRWKHDIWQQLGGGDDDVSGLQSLIESLEIQLSYLRALVKKNIEKVKFSSQSTSYTTSSNEYIRATAAGITITLNPLPRDLEEVWVQPTINGLVTISGSINGASELIMHHAYDVAHLKFISDANEWVIQ